MDSFDFKSIDDLKKVVQAVKQFAKDMTCRRLFELSINTGACYGYDQSEDIINLSRMVEPQLKNEPKDWGSIPNVPMKVGEDLFAVLLDTRDAFLTIGIFLGAQEADPTGESLDRLGDAWIRSMLKQSRYWHLRGRKEEKRLLDEYSRSVRDLATVRSEKVKKARAAQK